MVANKQTYLAKGSVRKNPVRRVVQNHANQDGRVNKVFCEELFE